MSEEKQFKQLIRGLFESYHLSDKFDEAGVINSWEQIVGRQIAQKTDRLYIQKKVLHLYLSSAPLKNELRYYSHVLIQKVNDFAQQELITELQIH